MVVAAHRVASQTRRRLVALADIKCDQILAPQPSLPKRNDLGGLDTRYGIPEGWQGGDEASRASVPKSTEFKWLSFLYQPNG